MTKFPPIVDALKAQFGDRLPEIEDFVYTESSEYSKIRGVGIVFKNGWRLLIQGDVYGLKGMDYLSETKLSNKVIEEVGNFVRMPRMDRICREKEANKKIEVYV